MKNKNLVKKIVSISIITLILLISFPFNIVSVQAMERPFETSLFCKYQDLDAGFLTDIVDHEIDILLYGCAYWVDHDLTWNSGEIADFFSQVETAVPTIKIVAWVMSYPPDVNDPDVTTSGGRTDMVDEVLLLSAVADWYGIIDDTENYIGTSTNQRQYFSECATAIEPLMYYWDWLYYTSTPYTTSARDAVGLYDTHAYYETQWKTAIDLVQTNSKTGNMIVMINELVEDPYPLVADQIGFMEDQFATNGYAYYDEMEVVGLYLYSKLTEADWTAWDNFMDSFTEDEGGEGELSDFGYRRSFYLESATAYVNVQVPMNISDSEGSPSGNTLFVGGEVQSDFDDVRFTLADGVTLIDAWASEINTGVDATVWVEFPTTNSTYYIYWGNTTISNAWSKENTFFDVITDLEIYYDCDENTGTTLTDYSGNGDDGTLVGTPLWDVGVYNYSSYLSTSATYSSSPATATMDSYTFAGWFNPVGVTNWARVMGWKDPHIYLNGGTREPYLLTGFGSLFATTKFTNGAWKHLTFTVDYSGGTSTINVYVNGTYEADTAIVGSDTGSGAFYLGHSDTNSMKAYYDQVQVFSSALTPTEVNNLFLWFSDGKIAEGEVLCRTYYTTAPTASSWDSEETAPFNPEASPTPTPTPTPTPPPTPTPAPDPYALQWYLNGSSVIVADQTGYGISSKPKPPTTPSLVSADLAGNNTVDWAWRVYLQYDNNGTRELTGGSPEVMISRANTGDAIGYLNNSLVVPKLRLIFGYTAVRLDLYVRFNASAWTLKAKFLTSYLFNPSIEASTWTINLYNSRNVTEGVTNSIVYWGTPSYKSAVWDVELESGDQFDYMNYWISQGNPFLFVVTPFTFLIGNTFYALIIFGFCMMNYIRSHNLGYMLLLIVLIFAGSIGNFMLNDTVMAFIWLASAFGLAGLFWKVFR